MTHLTRRTMLALTAAFGAGFGAPAFAIGQAEAETFVSGVVRDVTSLIDAGGSSASQRAKFRTLFRDRAAYRQVARFVIGAPWRDMSDAQRNDFTEALLTHVSAVYVRLLGEYQGQSIEVDGSQDFGKKGVLVKSVVRGSRFDGALVEWLVSDRGGRTELVDVIVEGVSLLQTQRQEFGARLESHGGDVDKLIADLQAG